jgi:parallel beta-helix repeat protein
MRYWRRLLTVGLSVLSLLALSFTAITVSAGAVGTLPATVNEVVAATASLSAVGCPTSLASVTPAPSTFTSLEAAVAAATTGQTIYVCAGSYDMSAYANGQVVIPSSLAVTIDGYNWDLAPSGSDTSGSVNSGTQSVFTGGTGILVESSAGVAINGLTLYENNAVTSNSAECGGGTEVCGTSIDVRSLVSGPGDQGESNVTIGNNLFVNTGGTTTAAVGALHFGLGGFIETTSQTSADVTVLDTNDVVQDNVFVQDQGFENNGLEMSDTAGATVTGNTVTFPANGGTGADDSEFTALSFPGYDQGTTISSNTLNGGGMFSNVPPSSSDLSVPKSGIKVEDAYGDGCSGQHITGNTISGFLDGIAVMSTGNTLNTGTICTAPSGPTGFTVSNNTVSSSRIYGIYVTTGATSGAISGNAASTTDTEGYTPLTYTAGQYDYFDATGSGTTNTWTTDTGTGTSNPASLETTTTTTTSTSTTTSTTTTTTVPPTTTTTVHSTTTTTAPPTTTTTAHSTTTTTVPPTTTTTVPPTTTTTAAPKPVVTISSTVHLIGSKVAVMVHCARAKCAGILQLTKKIKVKVEIGHSGKFHFVTQVLLLGKTGYVTGAGTSKSISIVLKAAGLKLVRSLNGHKFIAVLTFTSAGGTRHENVSLTVR